MKLRNFKLLILLMLVPFLGGCYTQFHTVDVEPVRYDYTYRPLYVGYSYVNYIGLMPYYSWQYYPNYVYIHRVYNYPNVVVNSPRRTIRNRTYRNRVITPTRSTRRTTVANRQIPRATQRSSIAVKRQPTRTITRNNGVRRAPIRSTPQRVQRTPVRTTPQRAQRAPTRRAPTRSTVRRSTQSSSSRGTTTKARSSTRSRTRTGGN